MDNSMKLYWELFFEKQTNAALLRELNNPIRQYENEMIDGAILDIGCGQSPFLLDYLSTDRKIIAVDNEQIQLDFLKKRVETEKSAALENWSFLNLNYPKDNLPDLTYSLIIFSNILHFFTLKECVEIGKLTAEKAVKGTLIYVGVHSVKFYANNPSKSNNNEYFRHYFTVRDLDKVFPSHLFERIYSADIDKSDSYSERALAEEWLERDLATDGITDQREIDLIKKNYFKNKSQSDVMTVYRKK